MSVFCIYNPDGSIWQANKVFDQPDYGKLLKDEGLNYVEMQSPTLIAPDKWFVNIKGGTTIRRPKLRITVDKLRIKAGDKDAAIFRNIPKAAKITVSALGEILHEGLWETEELELHIPVPMTYRVQIDLWPYQSYVREVEAFA